MKAYGLLLIHTFCFGIFQLFLFFHTIYLRHILSYTPSALRASYLLTMPPTSCSFSLKVIKTKIKKTKLPNNNKNHIIKTSSVFCVGQLLLNMTRFAQMGDISSFKTFIEKQLSVSQQAVKYKQLLGQGWDFVPTSPSP